MSSNDQGRDGTPFLSYYDRAHALSFVWDGTQDTTDMRWIDVSFGGYAEPVVLRIPWEVYLTGPVPGNVIDDVLAAFARTCEAFINQIHLIEVVDEQAHGRTEP